VTSVLHRTLRRARAADETPIARLHAESWRSAYRGILGDEFLNGAVSANRSELWSARFSALDRADQLILVYEERGELQGFACAFFDADSEWGTLLDNLHVAPRLKGQGLGRELLLAVAENVRRCGRRQALHLWVYEQNLAARRFYERLGGSVTASVAEAAPDGGRVNALRYAWRELSF
jgi:ribosomal protein S18 acetylase RimI-like enzyme